VTRRIISVTQAGSPAKKNPVEVMRDQEPYMKALASRHGLGPLHHRLIEGNDPDTYKITYTFERGRITLENSDYRVERFSC